MMNYKLRKAAKNAFRYSFNLRKGESVLIIYDKDKKEIADAFAAEAVSFLARAEKAEIPVGERDGEEPPAHVAHKMKNFNVIIAATTHSLTHTKARKEASKQGARIATLPGITDSMMARLFDVDYQDLKSQVSPLFEILKKARFLKILTEKGTNITINVTKQPWDGLASGIVTEKGDIANLPDGELYTAPRQLGTEGVIVFDASFAGIGKLDSPIRISVENGIAKKITGKEQAKQLSAILKSVHDPHAYTIAEIGIGTNPMAQITGSVLEDEKVKGTIHIALGNNTGFGGSIDVPIHVDGIVLKPTVFADKKKIIHKGSWVFA